MISELVSVLYLLLIVLICYVAFLHGRSYERKQFVKIGRKKGPTVQDMLFRKDK